MKRLTRWVVVFGALAMLGAGCNDTTTTVQPEELAPPLGLTSVTGSGSVTLRWEASNYGESRDAFEVYRASGTQSGTPETIPAAFGTTPVTTLTTGQDAGSFATTVTGLTNGTTYSFLVVASKDNGNKISRPSNIVVDTPRAESATTLDLTNGAGNPRFLDVATQTVSTTSSAGTDILCQSFNAGAGDRSGMVGQNGARVQDLGFVSSWDEIDKAPAGSGSYPAADYSVQVLPGHVYAVFTGDGYYAKLYIVSVHSGDFGFVCRVAFQPQIGNNELKPGTPGR